MVMGVDGCWDKRSQSLTVYNSNHGTVTAWYLKGDVLYKKLRKIFDDETTPERCWEVIHPRDSQCNESGHVSYRTKCLKDRDYAHSASSAWRVAAAVGELCGGAKNFHHEVLARELGIVSEMQDTMLEQHTIKRA